MNRPIKMLSATLVLGAGLGMATEAGAQSPQDPETGGQFNQCWGQVASGIAQLGGDDDISGGGMGSHSRSTTAADINGGFADSTDGRGPTFNELNEEGNHGRDGVGNVSVDEHDHPGDGGNGVHAESNGNLAAVFDPVDGQGAGEAIPCDVP